MCGIKMALSLLQVILALTLNLNAVCSTSSEVIQFLQVACSDPDLGDSLRGSELNRLAGLPRIRCAFFCYQTPDCFFAADVTIGGQKTCVHIAGKNKTLLFPAYASESDCTLLITGAYDMSCPAGLIGRFCEHSVLSKCNRHWAARNKTLREKKVHIMSHSSDEAAVTFIFNLVSASTHPLLMAAAFPFMSFDFVKRSFATPATREARHMEDNLLQITKVYTNGTEASFLETNVSSVLLYSRRAGTTRLRIFPNTTEKLPPYFLRGYRFFDDDYSVMERDPGTDVIWYYKLHSVPLKWLTFRPAQSRVSRFSNTESKATSVQQWFNETAYEHELKLHTISNSIFDTCWFESAENKLDVMNYVKAKVRDEGRPLLVLLDGRLSTDVLFLISTDEDVIAVTAPYIESPDKYKILPTPSIMVYTSVNGDGVQTQQKITFEGSTFHQVVDNGAGHDVKWFFSNRNWRKILRVTPNNEILYGSELDLRNGANQSYTISACAVHMKESWCFGTKVVAIMPDGEILMQSPSIPLINVQGRGRVFQDAPDLQVVMLRSRGGCQKMVYKMGVAGQNLAGCPGLKWLDWFIENF